MYGILIVEDNPTDAKIISYLLTKKNYTYHLAVDAHQALEVLEKYHIDLVLLDWMLPQISGLQLLQTIRSIPKVGSVPVMFISGKNELKDVQKAIQSGASDYLIKPVDPLILEAKLQRFLNQSVDWKPVRISSDIGSVGQAAFSIQVSRVSEVGIEVETEIPIECGALIELNVPMFEELGISKLLTKVFERTKEGSKYRLRCSIVGLKETDLQKVRLKIRSMRIGDSKIVA